MYRYREQGEKKVIYVLCIDSMGQQLQFQGSRDEAANQIELPAKLPDGGTSRAILTINPDGTLTVDNAKDALQNNLINLAMG
jgi:hypothetical protein